METLSPSMEHYIKAIYDLGGAGHSVRISDIASWRKVSKPSVCHAMCVLQELNMVRRTSRREVYLTTEGIHRAVRMNERYSAIKRFLTETLQVSEDLALRDACALEHLLSSASLSAISTYAG